MDQKRIAFYGKGGIGKTSLAANTAAELGRQGNRVLFIGCDPKSDSCISLTGKRIPNALQQSSALGSALCTEDILFEGAYGVCCLEAGGPAAGVGCAGMGFGIMMSELERLELLKRDWDVIIYDVLGDVVCSGFSVPMRQKYADKIFLVTTSAFMSLYAANNIAGSAIHLAPEGSHIIGGILHNRFCAPQDGDIIRLFCERTNIPCIATVSENRLWGLAECACKPLCQLFPDSDAARELTELASAVINCREDFSPTPLSVAEMDLFRSSLWDQMGLWQ